MKKILALVFSILLTSFAVSAQDDATSQLKGDGGYGMAGCGLGSMAFSQDKKFSQILAATTNGSFGTQTFGITSGTSNCTSDGMVMLNKETEAFVEVNRSNLEKEIAQGEGETLASFADLLGCENTSTFKATLKKDYANIQAAASNQAFLKNVQASLSGNAELNKSCRI